MKKKLTLLLFFILISTPVFSKTITRADAALYIAEKLNISHNDKPESLYGLAYGIFAEDYDGKNDITNYDKEMTLEVAIVTLVRYMGWNTVQYDKNLIEYVKPYVTQEGYPNYLPDPSPRSIPYVITALNYGLLNKSELKNLLNKIGYEELDVYISRLKNIKINTTISKSIIQYNGSSSVKNNVGKLIVVNRGYNDDKSLANGENTILDLRANGVRLYSGRSNISNGKQDYFPLGPLSSTFSVGMGVPENDYSHQAQPIYGTIDNYSKTVNAVGIWGNANSKNSNARVWGSFFNVTNNEGEDNDAQIIGSEIDVTNNSADGTSPNASKVGLQIVSLGSKLSTNAIEILAAGENTGWVNGILFGDKSIYEDGTVIGTSQKNIKNGIDFSNTNFSNGALLLSENSKIVFNTKDGSAAIYGDDINNGYLVLQNGKSGLRIVNNANNENILIINDDGTISKDCLVYKKYLSDVNQNSNSNILYFIVLLILIIVNYFIFNNYKKKTEKRLLLLEEKINSGGTKNESKKNNKK